MTLLNFQEELLIKKINPKKYLQAVQIKAMYYEYDWKTIQFTDDTKYKLQITRPDGKIIKFGASAYNDFIIYSFMAKKKLITYDEALKHRDSFHKRMIIKDDDIYSARNLSLNLLW